MHRPSRLIPAHGGYRELRSFQHAELVYDANVYQDVLRHRELVLWPKNHSLAQTVRRLAYEKNRTYMTYRTYIEDASAEVAANCDLFNSPDELFA